MFLMFAIGGGLSIAGSTLIAQYVGARNSAWSSHVAGQTLLMVVLVSLFLGVIGFTLAPDAAAADGRRSRRLSRRPGLHARVLRRPGLQLLISSSSSRSCVASAGRTLPVYIVLGTVLLNFVLDPLFIFGWGPVPGYGVMGAAIATLRHAGRRRDHRYRRSAARPARHPRPAPAISSPTLAISSVPSSWAFRPRSRCRHAPWASW